MGTLGDFTSGFQQGFGFTQQARRNRQYERAVEQELEKAGMNIEGTRNAANRAAAEGGASPLAAYKSTFGDPVAFKIGNWLKNAITGRNRTPAPTAMNPASAIPMADSPETASAAAVDYAIPPEGMSGGFADGGKVRKKPGSGRMPERLVEEEARQRRVERTAERGGRNAITRAGDAIDRSMTAPEGSGRLRRGLNSAVGRGGAAAALGATALTAYDTPTEQYRERFGLETDDPSLLGDIGVRAMGAASDLGNALTFGQAGRFYRDLQQDPEGAPADEAAPPPAAAIPPRGTPPQGPDIPERVGASARVATRRPGALPTTAPAQQGPAAADQESFDFSTVDAMPDEMPSMSTKDWVKYRAESVRDAIARGMSEGDAHQMVDQIQQRGFLQQGQQALTLLEAGNPRAAALALKAAYQYFPNGADVKFGIRGNTLVGMGFDEETGKPKGQPMILNSERLAVMLENFTNPNAFRAWTKDWRDQEFQRRKYEEVEKPGAQGALDYQNTMGRAAMMNAGANVARSQADLIAARTGRGGSPSLRPSDMRAVETKIRESIGLMALDDPQEARYLEAVMARAWQRAADRNPTVDVSTVIDAIQTARENGELEQLIREYGLDQ